MKKGFTLIEVLISIVVFSSVMIMTAGSLALGLQIKDKVERMQQVQDEARLLAEYVSRQIEMANSSSWSTRLSPLCADDTPNDCHALTVRYFQPTTGKWAQTTFMPSVDGQDLVEKVTTDILSSSPPIVQALNSERVKLTNLRFYRQTTTGNYVNVEMSFEERSQKPELKNGVALKSLLAQTTKIKLQFTAVIAGG